MVRRPCIRPQARSHPSRNLIPARSYPQAHGKVPSRTYSQTKDQMIKTIEKQIKECQISEHEFLQDYAIWDHIVTECAWKGKCLAGGKCHKESNCLANSQMAYLAWQTAQKETIAHEVALRLLVYETTFPVKAKVKK